MPSIIDRCRASIAGVVPEGTADTITREVLLAMREPTDEVIAAFAGTPARAAARQWRSLIDAILAQHPRPPS